MSQVLFIIMIVAVVAYAIRYGIIPAWRRGSSKKGTDDGARQDGPQSCKETCDIHGKVGEPIRYDCGHDDAPELRIDLWGEPTFHKKPDAGKLLCSDCMLKMVLKDTIRCGACGFSIMPGDPVALCVDDIRIGKKEWKAKIGENLIVCLRWECGNGPGFCGHWTGKGIKPAFPNGGNLISQVLETGEPTTVNIGRDDENR